MYLNKKFHVFLLRSIAIIPTLRVQNTYTGHNWNILFNGDNLDHWYTYLAGPHPNPDVESPRRDIKGNYLEPIGLNKNPLNIFSVLEREGEKILRISGEVFRALIPEEEWNKVEIHLHEDTSVHLINGRVNLIAYRLRQIEHGREVPCTRGKIQLQSEREEVFYCHIKVKVIDGIPAELLK